MKKYFMKETGNEVQFGDMIELDFTKDMKNGKTRHHHLECKFLPELLPLLKEYDVLEEREVEDEEEEIPCTDVIESLIAVCNDYEKRIRSLERKVKGLIEKQQKIEVQ